MITARGGGHHRGGRPAERHLYLAGVDFSQDPAVAGPGAVVGRLMLARLESGGLLTPKGPPGDSDDGGFSPFIAMIPPGLGFGRGGLQQPTGPQTQSAQDTPLAAARAQATGLTPAVAAETPETPPDVPPPVLPPEPTIVPDPPAPPVIVVVEIPPVVQPPPAPPPPETRPTPLIQSVAAPAVVAAVAAIPEPGTWAMLLLGFGAVGAAIRNRRRGQPAPEGSC
jgi:hypothetical protein